MRDPCPASQELFALRDGELSENRAEAVRRHVAGCAACGREVASLDELASALRSPVAGVTVEGSVDRLLQQLDAPPAPRRGRARPGRALAVAAGALAAAAALIAVPRLRTRPPVAGDVAARGGDGSGGLRRDVGVTLYSLSDRAVPLFAESAVGEGAKLVAGYRNVEASGPVYLILFGVDSEGTVHWMYPAFEQPGDDPASVLLPRSDGDTLMPTSVVLGAPSAGPMRLVWIVTRSPLRVSMIEALQGPELGRAALEARWPQADVGELRVVVRAGQGGGR